MQFVPVGDAHIAQSTAAIHPQPHRPAYPARGVCGKFRRNGPPEMSLGVIRGSVWSSCRTRYSRGEASAGSTSGCSAGGPAPECR